MNQPGLLPMRGAKVDPVPLTPIPLTGFSTAGGPAPTIERDAAGVPSFHVVFSLPAQIAEMAYPNKAAI
jgi:hypothetical protein